MSVNNTEQPNTRMRILAAAESVFVDKGYDGARVEEIAKKAHINKSQLFYYFGSKENILKELVRMHIKEAEDIIRNTFGRNTIRDKQSFESMVEQLMDFFRLKGNIIKITLIEMLKNSSMDYSIFELFQPLYEAIKNSVQGMGGEVRDSASSDVEYFYQDIIPIALFVASADKFAAFYKIPEQIVQTQFHEMYMKSQMKHFERLQKLNQKK